MDTAKLRKANDLDKKIREFTEALNCFEWPDKVSTNPRLIIEFDDDEGGRSSIKLPMELSNNLIDWLKTEITKNRQNVVNEFNEL